MSPMTKEERKTYFANYYECNKVTILLKQAEYKKEHRLKETVKISHINSNQRMRNLYPDKDKARHTIQNAIQGGHIKRGACEICGSTRTEAHHDDYAKSLEVRWLCHQHHRELEGRWIFKI